MRVQCSQCGAGGNIPDAKIPVNGIKIVCPKCKASFFVQPPPAASQTDEPEQRAGDYYQGGVQALKNKHIDAAIEQLREAVHMKPDYAEAYRYLGLAYGQKKLWDAAGQALEKAISYQANDVLSLKNLGVAYLQQKRFSEATHILRQALQYAPNDKKVQSYLSMAARGAEQASPIATIPKKDNVATTEIEAPPAVQRDPVQTLLDKGVDFLDNGQHNKAIEAFREVIRIAPQSSDGYFGLGMVFENRKDWPKTIDAYQKAVKMNPEDSLAKESLRFAKKQRKKFKLPFLKK